jgi:hypothetical protein
MAGRLPLARGELVERCRHRQCPFPQRLDLVAQIEPQRRQHLIVARPAQVDPGAGVADPGRQAGLERGMDVLFLDGDLPGAGRVLRGERLEAVADRGQVVRRQQPGGVQHLGVGDRGADVVGDEAGVQPVVLAGGVAEHPGVERLPLVPQAGHQAARPSRYAPMSRV